MGCIRYLQNKEERDQKEIEEREREIIDFDKSAHGLLPVTGSSKSVSNGQIVQYQEKNNQPQNTNNNNTTRKEDPRVHRLVFV